MVNLAARVGPKVALVCQWPYPATDEFFRRRQSAGRSSDPGCPMSPHLSAFRIPDTAEVLYRRVLRSATMGVAAHAAELGWTDSETMVALQSLISTRLVRLTGDGQVLV